MMLCWIMYYSYHHYFTPSMLAGTYVNTNYEYGPFVAETPYGQDSITLFPDQTFSSTYWGDGKYELDYSLEGTEFNLSYTYEFGTAGFQTHIERSFFSSPRIMLVRDMNHYMRKIKE